MFSITSEVLRKCYFSFSSLLLLSGCGSMLYAPTKGWHVHPEKLGFEYQEVSLTSKAADQEPRIHGWLFRQSIYSQPKGLILFFHGNGQNRSSHFMALGWMLDKGYDYFIFDYQGYGDSEGAPSPQSTVNDGMSAFRWITQLSNHERYHNVPLIVFAQSLGGAVALRSLQELNERQELPHSLKWVVLDSTFGSYQKAGASVLSQHWLTFIFQPFASIVLSDQWAPNQKWGSLPKAQYLVLHGDQDSMIDESLGRDLFQELPHPKIWMPIPGGNHINAFFIENGSYRERFLKILEESRQKTIEP